MFYRFTCFIVPAGRSIPLSISTRVSVGEGTHSAPTHSQPRGSGFSPLARGVGLVCPLAQGITPNPPDRCHTVTVEKQRDARIEEGRMRARGWEILIGRGQRQSVVGACYC